MAGKTLAASVAYPTIGIILLGGISDKVNRYPLHTSAGIAYTGVETPVETRTRLFLTDDRQIGLFNGTEISTDPTSRSPFHPIAMYEKIIRQRHSLGSGFISYESESVNILSGSSDSGAAALGIALAHLAGLDPYTPEFENLLRKISESVGRSLYGGLSLTNVDGSKIWTERLLGPEAFSDIVIAGFRFNAIRNPSDRIHENIVNHPGYENRKKETAMKGRRLKELSRSGDVRGIFDLAMEDTDRYHSIIEEVGVKVQTEEMRKLISQVREIRKKFWASYIVTGGSNVFVPVERAHLKELLAETQGLHHGYTLLKVAGPARVVQP
ncbi:MAG: diphosphomevalonate decarboxylase [Thermoplasmataceae archaeon]